MKSENIEMKVMSDDEELRAQAIFSNAWNALCKKYGESSMIFKSKIVFVNGGPGSGKSTNHRHIMRVMEIAALPIEVSALLTSPEAKAIKSKGGLVDDAVVVGLVFDKIIARKGDYPAVIIDGYPRTKIQAYVLGFLIDRLQSMYNNKHCVISLINLEVSRETSIQRQLLRGRSAIENNKKVALKKEGDLKVVRETDMNAEAAGKRWVIYDNENKNILSVLKDKLDYYEVNTEGSLEDVRDRIYTTLRNH